VSPRVFGKEALLGNILKELLRSDRERHEELVSNSKIICKIKFLTG
jgi:hypothetical protein